MSAWVEFYRPRIGPRYFDYFKRKYAPFLDEIVRRSRPSDDFLEIGCGMANSTCALIDRLTEADYWYAATDVDPGMLELAKLAAGGKAISFSVADARYYPGDHSPDLIHSHGLLEHLDDRSIRSIIAGHRLTSARASIHYVPSAKYEKPSFGDERLLTPAEWYLIGEPTSILEFNDGYDLVLVWELAR